MRRTKKYQEAKDILLLAFERAPIGKRLLFKLAELAIKEGSLQGGGGLLQEFCDLAPDDPRQYILRYLILGAKGAPAEQLIHTLEQYCNIELDEKWIYELAELYAEAGMGELCIMTCDKIMLMFGLGKYVEKAMELKIQFAPLTKYQMDLVENRDKYEARLKAVEQEYRAGKRPADYEPVSDRKTEVSPQSYMARQEAAFAAEPEAEYTEDGYPKMDTPKAGIRKTGTQKAGIRRTGIQKAGIRRADMQKTNIRRRDTQKAGIRVTGMGRMGIRTTAIRTPDTRRTIIQSMIMKKADIGQRLIRKIPMRMKMVLREAYGQQGYYGNEYPDQDTAAEEPYEDEGVHAQVTIEPEDSDEGEEPVKETQSQWMPDKPRILSDEAVRARMHEAEVQANLAKEMSRMSDGRHRPETTSAQTRVLTDIKDLGRESSVQGISSFYDRSRVLQFGSGQAIELLKEIHKETGPRTRRPR